MIGQEQFPMRPEPSKISDDELQRRRALIHRGLVRANTAAAIIVSVAIFLALAALYQAYRADQAKLDATSRLWHSYVAQARLHQRSGTVGQRADALTALQNAARIHPAVELRSDAIAALARVDLKEDAWAPNEQTARWIASGSFDPELHHFAVILQGGAISVRLTVDSTEVVRLTHNLGPVSHVRFSPNGRHLAARAARSIQVWDWQTGQVLFDRPSQSWVGTDGSIAFNQDGTLLAYGDTPNSVKICGLPAGNEVRTIAPVKHPFSLAFSPNANQLAITSGPLARLWDLKSNQWHRQFLTGTENINRVVWSADGALLAAASEDSNIYVWDVETQTSRVLTGHTREVVHVDFHPGNDLLVSHSWDATSRFWDPSSGAQILSTHLGVPGPFDPAGNRLGFQRMPVGLGVWTFVRSSEYQELALPIWAGQGSLNPGFGRALVCVAISPDGSLAAAGGYDGIWLWELATGKRIGHGPSNYCRSVHFLADGKSLITSGWSGLLRWPLRREPNISLGQPQSIPLSVSGVVDASALSADGKNLVVNVNGDALVVNVSNPPEQRLLKGQPGLNYLAVSPDSHWLVTGPWRGQETWLWNLRTGQRDRILDQSGPTSVAFSPDGQWLVTSTSSEYRLWKTDSWQPAGRIARDAMGESPAPAVFSTDSSVLAIACTRDEVALFDVRSGDELAVFKAPVSRNIRDISFSGTQGHLAVATEGSIQLWNIGLLQTNLAPWKLDWKLAQAGAVPHFKEPSWVRKQKQTQSLSHSGAATRLPSNESQTVSSSFWRQRAFAIAAFSGVLLAIGLGAFVWQRHRSFVDDYLQIEHLVTERNRELEQTQSALFHAQKMRALGTLAAGIAHDFNNLLSVVRMANKLTGRATKNDPDLQENVAMIEKAVSQGKEVVYSMLGYSREQPETATPFSVTEMVNSAVMLLSKQFLSRIELTLHLNPNVPQAICSRSRLEQILLNLIVNASEALAGRGKLVISVQPANPLPGAARVLSPRQAARYVELIVADSGPGIAPEILPQVFEPFFSTKKTGLNRGTGLGLSMVYALAEQDGLGVSLHTALAKGTRFHITIPAAD